MEAVQAAKSQSQTSSEHDKRSRTPPVFWDNLSQVAVCPRSFRELSRRTAQPIAKPPVRSVLEGDLVKRLSRFARHGGPNLRNIRGYAAAMKTTVAATMTITFHDAAFQQAMADHNYYLRPPSNTPMANQQSISQRLAQRRLSLCLDTFSEEMLQDFQDRCSDSESEATLRSEVFPMIRGHTHHHHTGQNNVMNHLTPLFPGLAAVRSTLYHGSSPGDLKLEVRQELKKYIVPCNNSSRPLLPNHFTELVGTGTSYLIPRSKLFHLLSNGARGMQKIQSYGEEEIGYDGKGYTFGIHCCFGGTLKIYMMYCTRPEQPGGEPRYSMTMIKHVLMTSSRESFIEGATWYRNSVDLAKELREEAIARANNVVIARQAAASAASAGAA